MEIRNATEFRDYCDTNGKNPKTITALPEQPQEVAKKNDEFLTLFIEVAGEGPVDLSAVAILGLLGRLLPHEEFVGLVRQAITTSAQARRLLVMATADVCSQN